MPLVSWGNGGGDYSQGFAYLAHTAELEYESNAKAADDKRLANQAAIDKEMFDRYLAGKVSDGDILAYIHKRIGQTAYDKTQQAVWKETLLNYTKNIADSNAATAFARTNDYGAYIGYLQNELASTKDAADKTKLIQQIQGLQDTQAQTSLNRGATRIANDIKLGRATPSDLLAFYRHQRDGLRKGSPLRDQITQAIQTTQVSISQTNFESSLANITHQLNSGAMTPVQAAVAQEALLKDSSLLTTDPARYYSLLDTAQKLQFSPAPADLAKLQYQLSAGTITPEAYQSAIFAMSDRLMSYDAAGAWQLRLQATQDVQAYLSKGGTFDPSYLTGGSYGIVRNNAGGNTPWISQMDGSAFANTNCVMASAAMLGESLGYTGLTGADLRAFTGDTSGGTNISQAYDALRAAGVDTSKMRTPSGWDFERWKQAIQNGSGSLITGAYTALPVAITNISGAPRDGGHGVYIASYDPKKGFLLLDPAVSQNTHPGYKGVWISEAAMQNFYNSSGSYHGTLLTPPHTMGPLGHGAPRVSGWSGPASTGNVYKNVNDAPRNPNTPRDYAGLYSPGPSGNSRGLQRSVGMDQPPIPMNADQAQQQYDAFTKKLDQLKGESAAWNEGKTDYNGIPLTPDVIKQVDHDILTGVDYMTGLQKGMGNFGNASTLQDYKTGFISDQVQRNTDQQENLWNQNMAVWADKAQAANLLTDPNQRYAALTKIRDGMAKFIDLASKSNPNDPLSGIDQQAPTQHGFSIAQMKATLDVMDIAIDPKADPAQQKVALQEAAKTLGANLPGSFTSDNSKDPGDAVGQVLAITQGFTEDKHLVDNQEGTPIVIGGQLTVVPLVDTQRLVNGVNTTVQVPDLSGLPADKNPGHLLGDQLPNVIVQTAQGPKAVPGIPQIDSSLEGLVVLQKDDPALQGLDKPYAKSDGLTTATIATLGPAKVAQLIAQGVIKSQPLPGYFTLTTPDSIGLDGKAYAGTVWHQDPHSNGWVAGSLPIASHSKAIPGVTDYVGMDPTSGSPDIQYGPYATQHEVIAPVGAGVPPSQAQYLMDHGWTDAMGVHHDLGHLTANADGTGNFVDAPLDANGNPLPDPNLSREGGMYYTPITDRAQDSSFDPTGFAQSVADKIAARVKADQAAADLSQAPADLGRYGEELPPSARGMGPYDLGMQTPSIPVPQGVTPGQDRIGGPPPAGFTPYDPTGATQGFGANPDTGPHQISGTNPLDFRGLTVIASQLGIKTPQNTPPPGWQPPAPSIAPPTPHPTSVWRPSLPTPGPITQPDPKHNYSGLHLQNYNPRPNDSGGPDDRGSQTHPKPYVPPPPPATRKVVGGGYES